MVFMGAGFLACFGLTFRRSFAMIVLMGFSGAGFQPAGFGAGLDETPQAGSLRHFSHPRASLILLSCEHH
jgi:hypothetical protein